MQHDLYIRRCLFLAANGIRKVAPNPMVGCVIVCDNKIIGEGYHSVYGGPHAEVLAINDAIAKGFDYLFEQSTLYVNLEPCSHFGKTPPCNDLILEKKIKHVVICNQDPNPLVAGRGIEKLKNNSVDVVSDVLTNEGAELNKRFFTFHQNKRPYIIIKFAESKDGFIAHEIPASDNRKISNVLSDQLVHQWRSEEQVIVVGTNTALIDNPSLTVRNFTGENPIRILIDKDLKIPLSHNIYSKESPTWVFNQLKNEEHDLIRYIKCSFTGNFIQELLSILYHHQILSIFVEGGKNLIQQFIDLNLWDEIRVITSPHLISKGLSSPVFSGISSEKYALGDDLITIYRN